MSYQACKAQSFCFSTACYDFLYPSPNQETLAFVRFPLECRCSQKTLLERVLVLFWLKPSPSHAVSVACFSCNFDCSDCASAQQPPSPMQRIHCETSSVLDLASTTCVAHVTPELFARRKPGSSIQPFMRPGEIASSEAAAQACALAAVRFHNRNTKMLAGGTFRVLVGNRKK